MTSGQPIAFLLLTVLLCLNRRQTLNTGRKIAVYDFFHAFGSFFLASIECQEDLIFTTPDQNTQLKQEPCQTIAPST
jgi:hypothetical protein